MWLFLTVPWLGLQCVIVVFPDHTYLHVLFMVVLRSNFKLCRCIDDDVEGTGRCFVCPWPSGQGQVMYFLVNASSPKLLEIATSSITGA